MLLQVTTAMSVRATAVLQANVYQLGWNNFNLSLQGGLKLLLSTAKDTINSSADTLQWHSQLGPEYLQSHLISKEINKNILDPVSK